MAQTDNLISSFCTYRSSDESSGKTYWITVNDRSIYITSDALSKTRIVDILLESIKDIILTEDESEIGIIAQNQISYFKGSNNTITAQWKKLIAQAWQHALTIASSESKAREKAALFLQKVWRGVVVRRRIRPIIDLHIKQYRAAVIIQRAFRRYIQRKRLEKMSGAQKGKVYSLMDLIKLHEASQPIEIVDYILVFENTKHPSFKEKEKKILEEAAKKKAKEEENRRQTRYQAPARTSVSKGVDLPDDLEFDANKSAGDLVDDEIAQIRLEQSRKRREHQQTRKIEKAVKEAEMAEVAQTEDDDDVNEVALFSKSKQRTGKEIEKVKQLIMTKLADRRIAFDEQKSVDGKNILLRISATFEALCAEAERLHIKKVLKEEFVTNEDDTGIIEFTVQHRNDFAGIDRPNVFFYPSERKRLAWSLLTSIEVTNDDKFGDIRFGDSLIPRAIEKGYALKIIPIHSQRHLKQLKSVWKWYKFGLGTPLNAIASYFGERVAAQFAFNEYLIKSLSILALVGIVIFVLDQVDRTGTARAIAQLVDVIVIFVWTSIFDRLWRRKNARRLYDTNSLKPTEPDMIRPAFIGKMQFSDITGHTERVYPTRLKVCRTVVSWIVSVIFLALSIAGQWATVFYETDLVNAFHVPADAEAVLFLVRCVPGLINGVLQMVLWSLYGRVAMWLTEFENHKRSEMHESWYAMKMVVFLLVNSSFSFFFIMFRTDLGKVSNEDELFKQLTLRANILLILQFLKRELGHTVIGNLIGSVPVWRRRAQTRRYERKKKALRSLEQEVESKKLGIDVMVLREAEKNLDDDQSRFNTPTPGLDLMSQDPYRQTQSRLSTMETADDVRGRKGKKGKKKKVRQSTKMTVVPRELMLELREKRREFKEFENEYNKRMSEVEFELSKGKYDYVQQYLDKLNYILQIAFFTPISPLSSLVALISGVLDTLSARYKLLNTKQRPIPSTRPNTSWMETSITTIIWASIPITTLELYYCFRAKLTDLFTGGYTPTTPDDAAFVFFIQLLAALALENLFLAVRAVIVLSVSAVPRVVRRSIKKDEKMQEDMLSLVKENDKKERERKQFKADMEEFYRKQEERKKKQILDIHRELKKKKRP